MWIRELQNCAIYLGLALGFYFAAGALLRSLHPTGILSWQGQRWRNGITIWLGLWGAWVETSGLQYHHAIPHYIGYGVRGCLILLLVMLLRWWWLDARQENAAKRALIDQLHEDGQDFIPPAMSPGKRAWRWTINAYVLVLVAVGLYALARYLIHRL